MITSEWLYESDRLTRCMSYKTNAARYVLELQAQPIKNGGVAKRKEKERKHVVRYIVSYFITK